MDPVPGRCILSLVINNFESPFLFYYTDQLLIVCYYDWAFVRVTVFVTPAYYRINK